MKFFSKLIVLSVLIFSAGCGKDFTDIPLNGVETFENRKVFETVDGINNYVFGCYGSINYENWGPTQWMRAEMETATDNAFLADLAQWGNASAYMGLVYFTGMNGDNSEITNFWTTYYRSINRCNYGIANIKNSTVIDDATKNRLIAELRFLRSFFYMDLVKNFGDIPLNDENTVLDNAPRPRTPKVQVWDFIINDLKFSAQTLPQRKNYTTAIDKGRASKGAALAYLSYAYLWTEDWLNAELAAKQFLELNEYSFEPVFRNIYRANYYNGMESIFEVGATNSRGNVLCIVAGASRADGGWGWCEPSSNLEKAYKDENDNVRRLATIITHGESAAEVGDPTIPASGFDTKPSENTTGRCFRKYYIPRNQRSPANVAYSTRFQPMPNIFMRYSHVLLNYAEALARQNKNLEALTELNKVRSRVLLPDKSGLSGEALLDVIVRERRLEFAGEFNNTYWDDLHRFKKNGKSLMAHILGPNGTFVQYNATSNDLYESRAGLAEPVKDKGKAFQAGTHELFPIPTLEIQRGNGIVTQNPGY